MNHYINFSYGISNSHLASITSNPLFINVAESIVSFVPINQFGCFKASFACNVCISSRVLSRNAPPEAVTINFSISLLFSPFKHWKIAECSLSTGIKRHPFCFASSVTICPFATNVSLLAMAISFFAFNASIVGSSPETPTTELNTRFESG